MDLEEKFQEFGVVELKDLSEEELDSLLDKSKDFNDELEFDSIKKGVIKDRNKRLQNRIEREKEYRKSEDVLLNGRYYKYAGSSSYYKILERGRRGNYSDYFNVIEVNKNSIKMREENVSLFSYCEKMILISAEEFYEELFKNIFNMEKSHDDKDVILYALEYLRDGADFEETWSKKDVETIDRLINLFHKIG